MNKIIYGLTCICLLLMMSCTAKTPQIPLDSLEVTSETTQNTTPVSGNVIPVEDKRNEKLIGSHDGVENRTSQMGCLAFGWLADIENPEIDLEIRVLVDGVEVAQAAADQYRPDLDADARCPEGNCAFKVDLWNVMSHNDEHTILVQGMDTSLGQWVNLSGSPKELICAQEGMTAENDQKPQMVTQSSGRTMFQVGQNYLLIEFLDDDLVHFELAKSGPEIDLNKPIHTSPMIDITDYPGPSSLTFDGIGMFETSDLRVQVDRQTLCLTTVDKTRNPELILTTLCPRNLNAFGQGISLTPESFTHAYGLGQELVTPGSADGDWIGRIRNPGGTFGNSMVSFNGGFVGNTQFPIVYFAGKGLDSYALFVDNVYRQRWDFSGSKWNVEMGGDWLRFYLMSGPDLQDLRKDYLELVGHPLVPPKTMFGLWISEFGYDNWAELENKLASLRANQFPVDGFVLDLQWFGGIQGGSDNTRMGSLSWDLTKFPSPDGKIAYLKDSQGIGIITIEESYIGKNLLEHNDLENRRFLVSTCETCSPVYLTSNPWWGKGGMMDWSNEAAANYWHDLKREPLINAGVMGHWTDLGEPEMYDPSAWYWGIISDTQPLHRHADVHNLYNLFWSRSIYKGYHRNEHIQRTFILSRSGAPGSQRYGVSMWSGDIGSNLMSLAAHLNAQMHMSMSGMDYYGSDIGGFHRGALDGDLNEMYTQWFANGMFFDIPARAHTENLCNCKETAPDRVGDIQSNLENVRLRYRLSPYLYSLSHRAYLYAEPVIPPLVFYYQNDQAVREMGDEKLLGRDLLVGVIARKGETERKIYLPAGDWINYYNYEVFHSNGEWFGPFPAKQDGKFQLPLFARAGAIIPQMYVDGKTMNISGKRSDGSLRNELIIEVFADDTANSFILYEDDGETIAYQKGEVRETMLSQQETVKGVTVTIAAATGNFSGAPESRDNVVRLVVAGGEVIERVLLNGEELPKYHNLPEWEAAASGWYYAGSSLVIAKSGELPVREQKIFEFFR